MGDKTYPLDDNYSKEQTVRVNVGSTKLISPEPVIDEIEKKCGVGTVLACVPKNDTGYEVYFPVMWERRNVGEISGDSMSIQENKCKSCLRTKPDCDCLTRKRYFGEGFGQIPEGKRKTPWGSVSDNKRKYQEINTSSEENNAELKESENENDLVSVNTSDIGPSVIGSEQGTSDDVKKSKVVKVVADIHTSSIMCDDVEVNGEDGNRADADDDGNGNGNDDDGNGEIGDDNEGDGIGNGDEDDEDEFTDADKDMEDDVTETIDNESDNGEKTKIATDNSDQTKIATDNGVKTKIATEITDKDSEQISNGQIVTVSDISKCNLLLSTNEIMNENVSCETTFNDEKISIIPSLEQKCSQGGDDGVCGELDEVSMDTDPLTEESEWASVEEKCKNVFKKNARRKSLSVKVNVKAAMLAHQKKNRNK
ncbi:unnamed protein product [Mytilus coruscus]|uniref:Uncharacterized protein n=1 Tax=Mytilus coruscus TaxID=42192 RepID=A0A6J8E7F8_MYTCO|nr:unnamed protein product [Mytilus coruscus]